jgi:hypothetical protein
MCKLSKEVVTTPPLISEAPPIKGLISDLSRDNNPNYAISEKTNALANALQNQPSNTGFVTVLPTFALMYRHKNVASATSLQLSPQLITTQLTVPFPPR